MGKGTIHVKDHKPTTLQVIVDIKRLYCHSAKIMANEKVFNPNNDFHNSTLIRINETLLDMFSKAFTVNGINADKEPRLSDERLALQRFAIADAKQLIMARKGRLAEIDTSYQCVRNFMRNGTSRRLIRRMDHFVENLKKEVA